METRASFATLPAAYAYQPALNCSRQTSRTKHEAWDDLICVHLVLDPGTANAAACKAVQWNSIRTAKAAAPYDKQHGMHGKVAYWLSADPQIDYNAEIKEHVLQKSAGTPRRDKFLEP
eukprot:951647-Pelagomonas_calceolata.AAC.2